MTSKNMDEDLKKLRIAATKGKWGEALKMYKNKRELRTKKISTTTGDTVLHMAVSSGEHSTVVDMLKCLSDNLQKRTKHDAHGDEEMPWVAEAVENGDNEKKLVLQAQNEKGNTPLHLAASATKESLRMCKLLVKDDPSLISICNKAGETPVFMAALHGNKEAFLWLHSQSPSSIDHNNHKRDSILHCALAGGHIDVAIEVIFLYSGQSVKEMALMRNKNGLRPIHILAATPSAFKSTSLPAQSFIARLLYNWRLFRVKKKTEATSPEPKCEGLDDDRRLATLKYICIDHGLKFCALMCLALMVTTYFLGVLIYFLPAVLLLGLLMLSKKWFHGILKLKEKHEWSLQIMEQLLQHASEEDIAVNPHTDDSEAGSLIVNTPLMIAIENGVIEVVEKILTEFPSAMKVLNEEGKNIVLLAAEKRQTRVYQVLYKNEELADESLFEKVDKDGNTALHLAAMRGFNLNMQTTNMIEEFKWFEFVKNSVPSELWEKYNNDGKTAEEIFRESYKEHMTSDRNWLNQTSQTCSVASTLIASMAFSNFAGDNMNKENNSSLAALSLSLTSTICFLAILAFRSQSLNFWRYAPFMLYYAIWTMIGSIVALWISLIAHGKSMTTRSFLGLPIAILTVFSLPIFIGHILKSLFVKVPPPYRNTTSAIRYRKPQIKGRRKRSW